MNVLNNTTDSSESLASHQETFSDVESTLLKNRTFEKKVRIADHDVVYTMAFKVETDERKKIETNAPRLLARPGKSSLSSRKSLETSSQSSLYDATSQDDDEDSEHDVRPVPFVRSNNKSKRFHQRRSDRGPSSDSLIRGQRLEQGMNQQYPIRRADPSRCSMGFNINRRSSVYVPPTLAPTITPDVNTPPKKVPKSKIASLWRRLTGAYKPSAPAQRMLCNYSGIGPDFRKKQRGDEITICVLGHGDAGKTSFIDNVTIQAGLSNNFTVITPQERVGRYSTKTHSHMITLKFKEDGVEHIVDIVEAHSKPHPPGWTEKDMMMPYLVGSEAAVVVIDSRNNTTLLALLHIGKMLKERGMTFAVVRNVFEKDVMLPVLLKKITGNMQVSHYEHHLNSTDDDVLSVVHQLVRNVIDKRITQTNIWGVNL